MCVYDKSSAPKSKGQVEKMKLGDFLCWLKD